MEQERTVEYKLENPRWVRGYNLGRDEGKRDLPYHPLPRWSQDRRDGYEAGFYEGRG